MNNVELQTKKSFLNNPVNVTYVKSKITNLIEWPFSFLIAGAMLFSSFSLTGLFVSVGLLMLVSRVMVNYLDDDTLFKAYKTLDKESYNRVAKRYAEKEIYKAAGEYDE